MNPVKKSIDLSYLDRFDATQGEAQIKIGVQGMFFKGLDEKLPNRVVLYTSQPAKDYLIVAVKEDQAGFEIKKSARGTRCCCSRFVRCLLDRGAELPQAADLEWDAEAEAYIARLTLITEAEDGDTTPPKKRTGRPRKEADK